SRVSAAVAENGTFEHGARTTTVRQLEFVPIPTYVEPGRTGRVYTTGLPSLDVRLLEEMPTRRLLAFRIRATVGVLARLLVDASLLAGVAALVRHGYSTAAASGAAVGGAPPVISVLLIALLALGAAGEYEIRGRRHHSLA